MIAHDELSGVPARLWRLVALAHHRLLVLDYDGTLAPFRVERSLAFPVSRSLMMLQGLSASHHTRLAIVSGRPLGELEQLVGDLPMTLVGGHGWERRDPDGTRHLRDVAPEVRTALNLAWRAAEARGWSQLIERKHAGIVLHTRGLASERVSRLERDCTVAWEPLAVSSGLLLESMDGGVELRAPEFHKGSVVLSLLSKAPVGTLGVFVGDDLTDEDAFEVLRDRGFGIRVGTPDRPTMAMGHLPSCDAVATFLEEWSRLCEADPPQASPDGQLP